MAHLTATLAGMAQRCAALKADGSPCGGFAGRGRPFCIVHDPDRHEIAQAGRILGGRRKADPSAVTPGHLTAEEAPSPPKSLDDWGELLASTVHRVLLGRVSAREAQAIVALAKAHERLLRARKADQPATSMDGLSGSDLARAAVGSIAEQLAADPQGPKLREELRTMLAEPPPAQEPPSDEGREALVRNPGPGVAKVLALLPQVARGGA